MSSLPLSDWQATRKLVVMNGATFIATGTVVVNEPHMPSSVYVIMAVPEAMPVTTPVTGSTCAIPVSVVLHVPPASISLNTVESPEHAANIPVIGGVDVMTNTVSSTSVVPHIPSTS